MIRLIASDLDGTLLDRDGRITPENADAVRAAASAGLHFVVATGRPRRWLSVLDAISDAHPLVIVSNGASLFDLVSGQVLRSHWLTDASVRGIVADLRAALPEAVFGLERGDLFGCEPVSPSSHLTDSDTLVAPVGELLDRVSPVIKMLVYHDHVSSDALASVASGIVGDRATVTHSLNHDRFGMLELSAPGITKAGMLAEVAAGLGVEASECVAFGDMPNDLEMLAWAGKGFAMADAHSSLLARFETVGSNSESGVGRAIFRLIEGLDEDASAR